MTGLNGRGGPGCLGWKPDIEGREIKGAPAG